MKIAIIGAGITGLTTAYELTKKRHEVTVFERSNVPGGLGTYLKVENNHIERFYHHFFKSHKHLIELSKELGISEKLIFYPAKTGFYMNGKIYDFSSPIDLLKFKPLSFINRIRCGALLAFIKVFPIYPKWLDGVSAANWLRKYSGKEVYETIWKPLLIGKFDQFALDVPALWLWFRVKDRSVKLGYFDNSAKTLFDALISKVEKQGGKIKLNSEINSVKENAGKVKISDQHGNYIFDKCIITTVSPIASLLIKSKISNKLRKTLEKEDQLGAVCLILELKKSIQSQYWLNICDPKSPVLVMIEHTNLINRKYYGGKTLVYLANYLHRSHPRFNQPEKAIIKEYSNFLKKLNPKFDSSWILNAQLSRVPRTQTIFKLNSLKTRPPVKIAENIYLGNIDQMYPHDRNLDLGIELAKKICSYF